jgi:hypothetical protein
MADYTLRSTPQYRQAMAESVRQARARMREKVNAGRIKPTGEVAIPDGLTCWVDPEDVSLIAGHVWHAHKTHGKIYARSGHRGGPFMHNVIMGEQPGMKVDHKDGNGLNNRRSNLRWATQSQNSVNTVKLARGASGFRGVTKHRQCETWRAVIQVDNRRVYIGSFPTPEEAARAYDREAQKHFGEFARLNFPEAASE